MNFSRRDLTGAFRVVTGLCLLLALTACASKSHKPKSTRDGASRQRLMDPTQVSQTEPMGQLAEQTQEPTRRRLKAVRPLVGAEELSSVERIVFSLSADRLDDKGRETKSFIEFDHEKRTARYERRWRNPEEKTNGVYCTLPLATVDYERVMALLKKAKLASFPDEEEPDPDPANCLSLMMNGRGPQIYSLAESGRRTRCASESLTVLGGAPLMKLASTWRSCGK